MLINIQPLMEVCNLCLQDSYPIVNTDLSKRLSACITFSRYLPKVLQQHPYACELCLQNFSTFINFHDIIIDTESKIEFLKNELSCRKITLKSICDGTNILEKCQHCRVCLKPVKWLGIYLYKNDTNILDFSLLKKMFSYCNFNLDYEATEHPILCRQCFEMLQIIYNFKKTITEAFEMKNNCDKSRDTCKQAIAEDLDSTNKYETEIWVRNDLMCQQIEKSFSAKANIKSDPKLYHNCFVEIERLPDMSNPVYLKTREHKNERSDSARKHELSEPEQEKGFFRDKIQERLKSHLSIEDDALAGRINWQPHKNRRIRSCLDRMCKLKKEEQNHKTSKNNVQEGFGPLPKIQGNLKTNAVKSQMARKQTRRHTSNHQKKPALAASKCTRRWNLGYDYTNDDLILLKLYYKYTKFEKEFPPGYWEIIGKEWRTITHKDTCSRVLTKKLYWQLSQRIIPQDVIDKIKSELQTSLEIEKTHHNPSVELYPLDQSNQPDSDDSFTNAVEYSDVPIKVEPPCDMDVEIWLHEPKIEPQSESETECVGSPPQLDRMDTPPCSAPSKKEALRSCLIEHNYSRLQKHLKKPKISPSGTRSFKNLEKEFRCTECFFTTQVDWAAKRHTFLHQLGKVRIYQCPSCTYRITSKSSLKIHMKTHYNDRDCPMLTPWYDESKQSREEKQEKLSISTQT